jgi:2'-hydroxyisoflavone reductase
LRLLVLGGTRFVGRALVEAALERGHELTLFNRGQTNAELFPGVARIRGDRGGDLAALTTGSWDAVVDVAAYFPQIAQISADALRGHVSRYLFVSTISVYADYSTPPHEDSALTPLEDPDDSTDETYGARKAECEAIVGRAFGEGATIVRPGLIVGPHDPTDRFSYWPKRIARGGRVLAPGDPADPLQFIDVRDLAGFVVGLLEDDRAGTFNATGAQFAFEAFLHECIRVSGTDAELVWVASEQLTAAGVDPWTGVPLWIHGPGSEAVHRVPIERARAAGLAFRPLADTIAAALEDDTTPTLEVALSAQREAELLELAAA